jgi:hypothetical protein
MIQCLLAELAACLNVVFDFLFELLIYLPLSEFDFKLKLWSDTDVVSCWIWFYSWLELEHHWRRFKRASRWCITFLVVWFCTIWNHFGWLLPSFVRRC